MAAGRVREDGLGFREEDSMRILFGEEIMEMADDGGFDGSATEHEIFMDVFSGSGGNGMPGIVEFESDEKTRSKVVEASLLCGHFGAADAEDEPQAVSSESPKPENRDPCLVDGCGSKRYRNLLDIDPMHVDSDVAVGDSVDALHGSCAGTTAEGGLILQNGHQVQQSQPSHAAETCSQASIVGASTVDDTMALCMQTAAEDGKLVEEEASTAAIKKCDQGVQMIGTSRADDPMALDVDTVAEVSGFGKEIVLSDPFTRHGLHEQQQQQPPGDIETGDQMRMVDTSFIFDTMALSQRGAAEMNPCDKAVYDSALLPYVSQDCLHFQPLVELGPVCHEETPGTIISSQEVVPGCSAPQAGPLVSSRRTLNRDLPDQLEAHAHRLLKDAGWNITARKRNDRAKMAWYFAAPHREVVVTSLTKAWKLCGQRLYEASLESERGKYPMEWSDVDTFWKGLTDTMAYVGEMTLNRENTLSLLQRWQLLDPFVAVVFIDKKITVLQKRKTLRAVDSSTFVLDDNKGMPSENKNVHKACNLFPSCAGQPILMITDSEYSQGANTNSNGHIALSSCHDLHSKRCRHDKHNLCCVKGMNCDADDRAGNPIHASDKLGQLYSGANLSNNLVRRSRKKSKRISEIEGSGLNEQRADSCMQSSSTCFNEKSENYFHVLHQEPNSVTLDLSNTTKVHVSEVPGVCSDVRTLKKHLKTKTKFAKPNGKSRNGTWDLSFPLEVDRRNMSWSENSIKELRGYDRYSESDCAAKKYNKFQIWPPFKESSLETDDSLTVSDESNLLIELSHDSSAAVLGADTSVEAQSCKSVSTKKESEGWKKYARKRPRCLDVNDHDLLITAIIKNKDLSSCSKFASNLISSDTKKFGKLKSPKNCRKLLVRTAGKGGKNLLNRRRVSLARRTVLCWLIATGFVALKDVVQYRNVKNNKVVKDGLVTWEGILCNCCANTLPISDFRAHASCNLPKSSLNLFLQSGKSYTLCQLEAWTAECMERRSDVHVTKIEEVDENDDTCGFCGDGGELLCCDNCPSTYHQACLSAQELPEGSWYCHNCICRSCGYPVSEKEVSSFSAILKCLQCEHAYHDTCVERDMISYEDVRSDAWFCGRNCKEIFVGLQTYVGIENFLDDGLSWTILRCNSGGQKLHSVQKIALMAECNTKLAVALTLMEECFVQMVDPSTGIDIIPHVLYNRGSNFARLDYHGFYTVILERADEILCVASIRVHGTRAAELPFVATCTEYRRQGMCRRLMDIIENMLRSFHVKMLVLSAIPELVSTWVSGFGFKPIEDDEKKELNNINLMLFPGASLLTKRLYENEGEEDNVYDVSRLPNGKCLSKGEGSEHWEVHNVNLVEFNTEKDAVGGSSRKLKDECRPAAWHHCAKVCSAGVAEP